MHELLNRDQFMHPADSSLAVPLRGARRISGGALLCASVTLWLFILRDPSYPQ
jgi:hypothetical protein